MESVPGPFNCGGSNARVIIGKVDRVVATSCHVAAAVRGRAVGIKAQASAFYNNDLARAPRSERIQRGGLDHRASGVECLLGLPLGWGSAWLAGRLLERNTGLRLS
jgi:hypothetical protein